MNETPLLKAFAARVPYTYQHVRIFRRNVAHGKLEGGGYVRNGIKGMADAWALVRGGRVIEIEAKSFGGKLSPHQVKWQAFCRVFDVPHIVLVAGNSEPPAETVKRWVSELGQLL